MTVGADIKAAADTFAAAKIAYTAQLTALATKLNAGQPVTNADWADLIINKYDPMTAASNSLRGLIATLTIGVQNLSETQFQTVKENPTKAFLEGYLLMLNAMLCIGDLGAALGVASLITPELNNELTLSYNGPDVPDGTPSVIFESSNDLMLAAAANFGSFDVVPRAPSPSP